MTGKKAAATTTKTSLTLIVEGKSWTTVRGLKRRLNEAAAQVAAHLPAKLRFPFTATVLLTTDAKVRVLNRDFRGKDKPTNVLSFPQFDAALLPKIGKYSDGTEVGDIAIAFQITAKEAKESNKLLINHVTHLTIHGLLHLFGYDHILEDEAETMERLETKIMKTMGLPDPYASSAAPKALRTKNNNR